jgi:hypothetical protein
MEMSHTRIVVAITAMIVVSIAGLYSSIVFQQMVDAVNQRLPQDEQLNPLGWYWTKYRKLLVKYRQFYPDRALEKRVTTLGAIGFAALLVAVWAIGFFR